MNPVDGILLVDKPQDWTSHDVCAFVRHRFKIKKVGHAGTLDPLATGLLVLLLGRATKKSVLLSTSDKEYEGRMELGVKTDAHDKKGAVIATGSYEGLTLEKIRDAAKKFTGDIVQVPPMVSALKHQGVRLYKLARRGVEVPRQGRNITVYRLDIESLEGPYVTFSCCVSKGTYVRTLVNDLGENLGCYAALMELRRTRSGEFRLADSVTVDQLRQWALPELRARVFSIPTRHANLHRD